MYRKWLGWKKVAVCLVGAAMVMQGASMAMAADEYPTEQNEPDYANEDQTAEDTAEGSTDSDEDSEDQSTSDEDTGEDTDEDTSDEDTLYEKTDEDTSDEDSDSVADVVIDPEETPEENAPVYITETQLMEPEDYQVLQNKLYAIGREANKSVVAVRGIGEATDWFDNAYETESQGTGIIVADTGDEYLVVTEKKVISDASQVEVTFYNNDTASAVLQAYDENTGIAMLCVEKRQLSADTTNQVAAATLSSFSALSQGTIVIAIGSPLGEPFSILTGNVTSSSYEVSTVDANYKVISTDINASDAGSGALINLKGEVVGLMLQSYSTREAQSTVTAISISQISKLLEKMSNGESPAYLGLEICTVTAEIAKSNELPKGIYIKQVSPDSPAMQAGIQVGDVLTKIDSKEILTAEQYEDCILNAKDGQQSTVTVKRMGADGKYQDLRFKVVFGTLQEN